MLLTSQGESETGPSRNGQEGGIRRHRPVVGYGRSGSGPRSTHQGGRSECQDQGQGDQDETCTSEGEEGTEDQVK